MEKNGTRMHVARNVRREYGRFKRKMLRQRKEEIWEGCQKIWFYGCVMEYFQYGKESSGHSWEILRGMHEPIAVMWDCYTENETLACSTWKEIEEILDEVEKTWGRERMAFVK